MAYNASYLINSCLLILFVIQMTCRLTRIFCYIRPANIKTPRPVHDIPDLSHSQPRKKIVWLTHYSYNTFVLIPVVYN